MSFIWVGETAAGHYFEINLADVSTVVNNAEVYNCSVLSATANTGIFYFEGPAPASPVLYQAEPFVNVTNTLVITVTTHNVAAKTITGIFSGNALDENGVVKTISQGTFTVTYP